MSSQEFNDDQKAEFAKVQQDVRYARAKFDRLAQVYEVLDSNGSALDFGDIIPLDGMSDDDDDDDDDDDAPGPSKRPSKRQRQSISGSLLQKDWSLAA